MRERDEIKAGLEQADVRAFVRVMGILSKLESTRSRFRILAFVHDALNEQLERDREKRMESLAKQLDLSAMVPGPVEVGPGVEEEEF